MSRRLLTDTFGFDSRCFVCHPENQGGMRQRFYLDEDANQVVAEFTPGKDLSGAPNYAHGGASLAVLDDAMAWAVIALKERFGVTRHVEAYFQRPVRVGARHEVRAWVESAEERTMVARGEILDEKGRACVSTQAIYTVLTFDEARQAIGKAAEGAASYTQESR